MYDKREEQKHREDDFMKALGRIFPSYHEARVGHYCSAGYSWPTKNPSGVIYRPRFYGQDKDGVFHFYLPATQKWFVKKKELLCHLIEITTGGSALIRLHALLLQVENEENKFDSQPC